MENKLQQLTSTLYAEGLEKGRTEAERLVAEAKTEAEKILANAKAEADAIVRSAELKAQDVEKNSLTEIALAGKQAVAKIKSEIAQMIVAKSSSEAVKAATLDADFVKEMLVAVAKNWDGSSSSKVELKALLPQAQKQALDAKFEEAAKALLAQGIEVGYSAEVKSGFKVGQKGGGYYISFTDEDFDALMKEYLREKVATLLYEAK